MPKCANCGQLFPREQLRDVEGTKGKLTIIFSMCVICCIDKGLAKEVRE